jgi:outer membrane protein TolC
VPRSLTLAQAQANAAAASKVAELARLNAQAARYHRLAVQADYFPKISATSLDTHFNKFLGQEIQLARRTAQLPLLKQDQTFVAVTAVQPLTPLFKIHQAVRIARADERAAWAKSDAAAAELTGRVQNAYFDLLIAQQQEAAAQAKVRRLEGGAQVITASAVGTGPMAERRHAVLEASQVLITARNRTAELTESFNVLIGMPPDTLLSLNVPPPVVENVSSQQTMQQAIDKNPAVIDAAAGVAKARAATRLAKLDYVPDVAILGGYAYQTAIPLLPHDFSFVGVAATWTVFDFGKRERIVSERSTELKMAEANLELTRAKVGATIQKTFLDLQRSRRMFQLARRIVSMYQTMPVSESTAGAEVEEERASAEAEMLQADLEYRTAYAQWKSLLGEE